MTARTISIDAGDTLLVSVNPLVPPVVVPPPPPPPPVPTGGYDAVFAGDATGATDVTASLSAFLLANSGKSLALAPNGVYRVSRLDLVGATFALAFRGARLVVVNPGTVDEGTVTLKGGNTAIDDLWVVGAGYAWTATTEGQHGVSIIGGTHVLNRPKCQKTRGDGIYVGYGWGQNPATGVVINDPVMEQNARNGIAVVAGEASIYRGHVWQSGLHNLDLEPNTVLGAQTSSVLVDGTDLRLADNIAAVPGLGYAIGGGWGNTTRKKRLIVRNVTADRLECAVAYLNELTVTGCKSDAPATFEYWSSAVPTFSGNANVTLKST